MPRSQAEERPAALEEFMAALRQLREHAGKPSFRQMAARSGAVSHATLHLTVTGYRLQPWETVREFVRACGGDEAEWHARWQRVSEALTEQAARQATPEPSTSPETEPETPVDDPTPERAADTPIGPSSAETDVAGDEPDPTRTWWRSPWLVTAAAVVLVAVLTAVVVRTTMQDDTAGGTAASGDTPAHESKYESMVHQGDRSKFLRDVTYPDGSVVPTDSQFIKVWELRNSGSVHWRNRYLQRIDMPIGPEDCSTPVRTPVPNTSPGQNVQITVTVRTPSAAPVDCKVRWKMVDEAGRVLMPGYRPIYFEVRVR